VIATPSFVPRTLQVSPGLLPATRLSDDRGAHAAGWQGSRRRDLHRQRRTTGGAASPARGDCERPRLGIARSQQQAHVDPGAEGGGERRRDLAEPRRDRGTGGRWPRGRIGGCGRRAERWFGGSHHDGSSLREGPGQVQCLDEPEVRWVQANPRPYGGWENLWSCEQTCVVKLVDREAVIDKLVYTVYTASNPVADHLVDRVHHWPGVNGLGALLAARPLRATRPLHFFRPDGSMPDTLELPLTLPAELGPTAPVLSELRDRVRAVELERAAQRARTGGRVLGRRAVLAQSWRDAPASLEPRRNLRPRIATRSQWPRIEALLRNRAFAVDYADARERWRNGLPAVFPAGTYWLQRFASVPVLET
jgi:hypothetical protein